VAADEPLVPPGSWPCDPAGPDTPVARSAGDVAVLAESAATLGELTARQSVCRACPRLVAWREQVATERRRAFRAERYWGRPVPGWGAESPRLLIVGLAPAAHGGNRTGRIFTGDRSGDFLFASLYRCGLAVQPTSVAVGDGQRLVDTRMAAAVRCAPPDNKPEPAERDACAPWLVREIRLVADDLRVVVCLGGYAWQAIWPAMRSAGFAVPRPRPAFGHGAEAWLTRPKRAEDPGKEESPASPHVPDRVLLIGCYHPSQQNTFTGRVTPAMLDAVFTRARAFGSAGFETFRPLRSADLDHVISYTLQFFPKMAHGANQNSATVLLLRAPRNCVRGYYGRTPVAQRKRQTP
jgi:uracil-DNA glycosylase family 4